MSSSNPERFSIAARIRSFGYAFAGLAYFLRTQHNAWIHMLATVLVIAFAIVLPITRIEWALLILAIAVVWIAEAANTAIEAVVDMTMPDIHPLAKAAKDVAAGAVLIAAVAAAIVGFLILGPPLIEIIVN